MSFDQQFWEENGYVLIPNMVSQPNLQAVIDAIWKYTGKDPNDRASWYQEPLLEGAMVNMANSQPLWDNRQTPAIHQTFAELWGTEKLWVVLDRVNMNPPEPLFQGVLYLTDTTAAMGGFQCVPGSHRRLLEWQATHSSEEGTPPPGPAGRDWMMQRQHPIKEWVMTGLEPKSIPAKAGDFLIWHVALLHGNGKNISDRPRLAQYISLTPEGTARSNSLVHGGEELRQARLNSWRCGPYPGIVAAALGAPEGLVSQWLYRVLENPAEIRHLPPARFKPRLTTAQLEALPDLLASNKPQEAAAVVHAKSLPRKYGIGGFFVAAELLSEQIASLMATEFGLAFEAEPARLTELGQKLLGLETWG